MYYVETNCNHCTTGCGMHRSGYPWSVHVYAVIQQEENIMLVKPWGAKEWTLPGGKVSQGGDVEESLRDYVLHSTGLEILMRCHPHVRECPHKHHFLLYREAIPTSWSLRSVSPEKEKRSATQWCPLNRLPCRLSQHAKQYLLRERRLGNKEGTLSTLPQEHAFTEEASGSRKKSAG